jgi:hypothetical protein
MFALLIFSLDRSSVLRMREAKQNSSTGSSVATQKSAVPEAANALQCN